MLRTRALSKPAHERSFDLLFVGFRMPAPEVLAHQLYARIEEVEREPKRPDGVRRRGHAGIVTPPVAARQRAHVAAIIGSLPPLFLRRSRIIASKFASVDSRAEAVSADCWRKSEKLTSSRYPTFPRRLVDA